MEAIVSSFRVWAARRDDLVVTIRVIQSHAQSFLV